MNTFIPRTLLAAILAFSTVSSQAATTLFNVLWSSGSGTTASGTVGIDTAAVPNPGTVSTTSSIPSWLTSVELDVAGSSGGDGHYTLADFAGVSWSTSQALDLGTELVGQPGFADFNLVRSSALAPTSGGALTLVAGGGGTESMSLQSLSAAPEPSRALLLLGGMLGLLIHRRRQVA